MGATLFCGKCGTLLKPGVGCPRCDSDLVSAWERAHSADMPKAFEGI